MPKNRLIWLNRWTLIEYCADNDSKIIAGDGKGTRLPSAFQYQRHTLHF